jgi:uncharacterized membrane protein
MSRIKIVAHVLTAVLLSTAAFASSPVFITLNDQKDPTFNQLLGINNEGVIAGYFGSGAPGHPNQGYTLLPPYGQANYVNENFPGSVQTQVVGINNQGRTVGFYIDAAGLNHGFTAVKGVFTTVDHKGTKFNQLLGQNDHAQAAGFFNSKADGTGTFTGYVFDELGQNIFATYNLANATSVQVTGVNNLGTLCGFWVDTAGATHAFSLVLGHFTSLDFPGSASTQAFGLNNKNQVVGSYVDVANQTHGFVYNLVGSKWESLDDPNGIGTTIINGINDNGDAVGFYVDANGNTDGMLITGIQ